MVQGQVFLKKKGVWFWYFFYLVFLRFIIFAFRKIAKLCHAFEEKVFFFCHHDFMKKGHSKLFKNERENIP